MTPEDRKELGLMLDRLHQIDLAPSGRTIDLLACAAINALQRLLAMQKELDELRRSLAELKNPS